MTGFVVLVVVLGLCTAFGVWFQRRDGRLKAVPAVATASDSVDVHPADRADHGGEVLTQAEIGSDLGERATLVQFSSAFCQPCRATKLILADLAETIPGVAHVEVDAETHLGLVRQLGIRRTPTVLVLDAAGVIRQRAVGQPKKSDVVAAVATVV